MSKNKEENGYEDKETDNTIEEAELFSIEGKGIGIDLGTTNSEVSYVMDGSINNLKFNNDKLIPSAIFFESSDKIYYGKSALKRGLENKKSVIRHFKRKLKDKNDPFLVEFADQDSVEKGDFKKNLFGDNSTCGENGQGPISITGEEASALFLRYLKEVAMAEIGNVTKAVITVPANFNNVEIEATKKAAKRAGFSKIKILKEPTAAAIAYSLNEAEENKKILIYDFGGGTFDVSIIEVRTDTSGNKKLEIIRTGGNPSLGGEDLTQELVRYIYGKLEKELNLVMSSPEESGLSEEYYNWNEKEIYKEAERRKNEFCESEQTIVTLPIIYIANEEQKKFELELSRGEFEQIIEDKVKESLNILDSILESASLKGEDIDIIALAGGSSQLTMIQNEIEKHFGRTPKYNQNTATVISEGAAIIADLEWNDSEESIGAQVTYQETTTHDFGVSVKGRIFDCLINSGEKLPTKAERVYSLGKDNQENLRISVFRRDSLFQSAQKTFDKGIEFVDEILITNLPPLKKTDVKIIVTFELTQEDILKIDVKINDLSGNLIDSKDVIIEKSSRMQE